MNNRDIDATWHYHHGTKHPGGYLMDQSHFYDPAQRPLLLKIYKELEPIPLPVDKTTQGMPALEAISTNAVTADEDRLPDIDTLARLLYFSAGITKRINYPGLGRVPFRAAACTGALYHIELYVVCRQLPGLAAGVYHYDPRAEGLDCLREGDYRRVLIDASGHEPNVARAPAVIVYSDVFWRNACKYQAREYRHTFWDSGTILSHTLAMATVHRLPVKVVAGFVDQAVNDLLELDTKREVVVALAPVGQEQAETVPPAPDVRPLRLETEPLSPYQIDFPSIREMHQASSLTDEDAAAAWRGRPPPLEMPEARGQLFPLQSHDEAEVPSDPLEPVIIRRGSARQYARIPLTFKQLSTILQRSLAGIPADFLAPAGTTLNHVYLIANAIDGLSSGAYVLHRQEQALELLKEGNFRHRAGHLGLGQDLAADASADVFFLADLRPILERFGNRGYRAAQLEASIAAGRIYLAAYAQNLGASGLTFFDDDVTSFFSPHARDKSVMFMMTLGKKR